MYQQRRDRTVEFVESVRKISVVRELKLFAKATREAVYVSNEFFYRRWFFSSATSSIESFMRGSRHRVRKTHALCFFFVRGHVGARTAGESTDGICGSQSREETRGKGKKRENREEKREARAGRRKREWERRRRGKRLRDQRSRRLAAVPVSEERKWGRCRSPRVRVAAESCVMILWTYKERSEICRALTTTTSEQ